MDLSLPEIDGWEATRILKADKSVSKIPIIALTAHAMAGIKKKRLVRVVMIDTKRLIYHSYYLRFKLL